MNIVCGIDIGGTTTKIGLVDIDGNIIKRATVKTQAFPEAEQLFSEVGRIIKLVLDEDKTLTLKGIGIGAPNGNYFTGSIDFAPNLPWHGIVKVTEIVKNIFPDIEVILTNDANAAALGEMYYGAAKNEKDFIIITLGTGVGSGIVCNGELIYGSDGNAGEIGHTIYDPDGRQCGCGRKGCLETYTSATGIVRTAVELLKTNNTSSLNSIPSEELSSLKICEAAIAGDKLALDIFDITAKILAVKLSDAVAHTGPSKIYIFGGVANAGDLLMVPLKKYFNDYLLNIYKNKVTLELSGLPQSDAAILGSAALVTKYI